MKKFTFEELPDVVVKMYEKIEAIESFLEDNKPNLKKKNAPLYHLVKEKCSTYFNKSDLAQLFYILMDEKIFFFDDHNQKCNRSKIQLFVEENFTYKGDSGLQTTIETISKQFSESKGFTYKDKQIKFIESMINTLEKRKDKLIGW
ncbi:hypothetical protein Flavo103_10210 [Flavobacterium collinsii]|uniref:hypothetical protein n=1 Tax=Flavobacterium collinsii TaxID=1114861 RepID=UPI0022BB8355|nr:hypothetical protein [Flavobacterium collinsii]GIQ57885.1 hypothetical protein Flavo103_10210 [Flavobacterium collinsii]